MQISSKIAPCLWFDNQGEDAAKWYVSIFPGSKIVKTSYYGKEGVEVHGRPAGSVMTVVFELAGLSFTALNGGPHFKFSEAISFQVNCENQDEVDYFWGKLLEGGQASQCGWLKDKFGLSWQIIPVEMNALFSDPDPAKVGRAMNAMLQMVKLDIEVLKKAHAGK